MYIYNYIDKPDFIMNVLVDYINKLFGRQAEIKFRLPFALSLFIGSCFDFLAKIAGKISPLPQSGLKFFAPIQYMIHQSTQLVSYRPFH